MSDEGKGAGAVPGEDVRMDEGGVALPGAWRLAWDDLTGLRYHGAGWGGGTETVELIAGPVRRAVTFHGAEAPGADGVPRHQHRLRELVCLLAQRRPGLQVAIRRGGWVRWTGFVLGLVCLIGGAGLWLAAALAGIGITGGIAFLVIIVIGAALASANRPGRGWSTMTADAFCAYLEGRVVGGPRTGS